MGESKIEWTQYTWNPLRAQYHHGIVERRHGWHCEKISPGCANCYAERQNLMPRNPYTGTGMPYTKEGRNKIAPYLDTFRLEDPIRWTAPRTVFVCSMTDLFGNWVPTVQIANVFAIMALTPRHTYQVLTKRHDRMEFLMNGGGFKDAVSDVIAFWRGDHKSTRKLVAECESYDLHSLPWPLPNVWVGVSAEDQRRYDERVPYLLAANVAHRFVSIEPMLGAIDLHARAADQRELCIRCGKSPEEPHPHVDGYRKRGIDWVIAGGESGRRNQVRVAHVDWFRSLRDQCRGAGVPFFLKQLGRWVTINNNHQHELVDRKGGNMDEWPEDLRVRELPLIGGAP